MKAINTLHWRRIFLVFGILLDYTSGVLRGKCRECLSNSVACLDEKSFTICKDGKMTNNITPCPEGTVCTGERKICLSTDVVSPACYEDKCNTCDLTKYGFACLDKITYGFCYEGVKPDASSIRPCPKGRICSLESPAICVLESDGGLPSCNSNDNEISTTDAPTSESVSTMTTETITPTEPTTTPTDRPLIDPNVFCSEKRKEGNFKDIDDLTCKKYIYCYLLSGQYLGLKYHCAGYFNAEKGRCQLIRPNGC